MNRKAKPSIDSLLRSFKHVLDASDFPDAVKDKAPLGLKRLVGEFLGRRENRGGRRTKLEAMCRARKTLKHVTHAVGHAGLHEDANIQTRAKALVRSLQHSSYDEIEQQASKFNGLLRKAGQRRNERRRKKARRRYKVAGVTADDIDTFSRVGAFCTILDSRPKDVPPIAFDGREFRI